MLRGIPRLFTTPAATGHPPAGPNPKSQIPNPKSQIPNPKSQIPNPKSRGFTLLEVILALGLSGLVLVAVAMAIDFHLRLVNSNRTGVEEAQLARVLLDRIAEDLSNVVQKPTNVEKLVASVVSQGAATAGAAAGTAAPTAAIAPTAPTAGGNTAGGTSTGGTAAGGASTGGTSTGGTSAGGASTGGTGTGTSSTTGGSAGTETDTSAQVQSPPGLYGTANELQVDTSRLPRIDEIQGMLATEGSAVSTVQSDVKTVAYYVLNSQLGGAGYASGLSQTSSGLARTSSDLSQTGMGLVRLEFDRATAAWLAQQGQLVAMTQDVEPIAPEVAAIEFRYYDGTEVLEEWDSSQRGGLPVAVEIAISIIPARHRNDPEWTSLRTTSQGSLVSNQGVLVFRRLVYLPTAQPTTANATSTTSGTSSEGSAGGSTGATGQGSTGGSVTGGGSTQ